MKGWRSSIERFSIRNEKRSNESALDFPPACMWYYSNTRCVVVRLFTHYLPTWYSL